MPVSSAPISLALYPHGQGVYKTVELSTGESGQIALTVPAMAATKVHVVGGVLFPRGELLDASNARVVGGGVEIPASFEVLCSWPDGSIKSLGVGVSVVPSSSQDTSLTLVYDQQAQQVYSGITLTDGVSQIVVDTGEGVWTLSKTSFSMSASVSGTTVISAADIIATSAHDSQDYKLSLDSGYTLTQVFADTQKVVYLAQGSMTYSGTALGKMKIWLTWGAGCDHVDVLMRFYDDRDDDNAAADWKARALPISISSYRLELSHSLSSYALAKNAETYVSGSITGEHRITQVGQLHFTDAGWGEPRYSFSCTGESTDSQCAGWMSVSDGSHYAYCMQRHFWEQFPGEINVNASRMRLDLHTTRGLTPDTAWPAASSTYTRPNTFYFNHAGGRKTYEIRIGVASGVVNNAAIAAHKTSYDAHIAKLKPSAASYVASGVYKDIIERNSAIATLQDEILTKVIRPSITQSLAYDDRGNFLNWGWRDFGDGAYSGTVTGYRTSPHKAPTWYMDNHGGCGKYALYFVSDPGDPEWLEIFSQKTIYSRDFFTSCNRRFFYWYSPRLADGTPGVQVYTPPGEPMSANHTNDDHSNGYGSETHWHGSGFSDAWILFGDRAAKDTMDQMRGHIESRIPTIYNHHRKYPSPDRRDGPADNVDRSYGWPFWSYLELYRAYEASEMLTTHMSSIVNFFLKWIKAQTNSNGGFPQVNHYNMSGLQVDPRTGSSLIDWSSGTGNFMMVDGQTNKSGGDTNANSNNCWQLCMSIVSLIRFHDIDTDNSNVSAVNLGEVREALYQSMRHQYIWSWDNTAKRYVYSEGGSGYSLWDSLISYCFARMYEFWIADRDEAQLLNPLSYYDQMSNIKTNLIEYQYNRLLTYTRNQQSYGVYGEGELMFQQEAFVALSRARLLS